MHMTIASDQNIFLDEFLDKNSAKSYLAKYNILKLSKYHLAKVLIFVPAKYKKLI